MNILTDILGNRCLWIPFFLWLSIQLFKFFYEWIVNKKIDFHRLFGAGGMPSSHSAVVCSLAALVGRELRIWLSRICNGSYSCFNSYV